MVERAESLVQHSRFSFLRASRPSYFGASNVSVLYGFNIQSGGFEITALRSARTPVPECHDLL